MTMIPMVRSHAPARPRFAANATPVDQAKIDQALMDQVFTQLLDQARQGSMKKGGQMKRKLGVIEPNPNYIAQFKLNGKTLAVEVAPPTDPTQGGFSLTNYDANENAFQYNNSQVDPGWITNNDWGAKPYSPVSTRLVITFGPTHGVGFDNWQSNQRFFSNSPALVAMGKELTDLMISGKAFGNQTGTHGPIKLDI